MVMKKCVVRILKLFRDFFDRLRQFFFFFFKTYNTHPWDVEIGWFWLIIFDPGYFTDIHWRVNDLSI